MTRQARERALAGGGPTLIAANTMRMHGHGAHDDARYVPAELLERWAARDPLERQRAGCVELGVDVAAIDAAGRRGGRSGHAQDALAMPAPDARRARRRRVLRGRADAARARRGALERLV